jgi:DNA segregation ATPase FtsK/SpoIIIE, S-DNA-T family
VKSESLSAPETLKLLGQVSGGVRSFADREKGLDRARQLRDSALRQTIVEQQAEIEREHRAAVSRLREEDVQSCDALAAVGRTRRARLEKGQIVVRQAVIAGIQASEGQHRAALQRNFMNAGRKREQRLAEVTGAYEEGEAISKKILARFAKLEKAAAAALRGFGSLQRRFLVALKEVEAPVSVDVSETDLNTRHETLSLATRKLGRSPLVAWFSGFPLIVQLFLVLAAAGAAPLVMPSFGMQLSWVVSLAVGLVLAGLLVALWVVARKAAQRYLDIYLASLVEAKGMRLRYREGVEIGYRVAVDEIEVEYARVKAEFDHGLKEGPGGARVASRYAGPEAVEKRAERLKERLAAQQSQRVDRCHQRLADRIAVLESARDERLAAAAKSGETDVAQPDLGEQFESLVRQWTDEVIPAAARLRIESESGSTETGMSAESPEKWSVPLAMVPTCRFGSLSWKGGEEATVRPKSERLALPGEIDFHLPLRLRIPGAASLLIETKQKGREEAIAHLNYLVLSWLAGSPAGRLSFSLVDPVGLGESFAGLMHLADYEEILINTRIRTQPEQIERRLGELCDHMEKVIQMYLRSDYETITQYNEAAGTIAERYHFLVVADFPKGFTELAARRLMSIAASGARCGVFLLIHRDERAEVPQGFSLEDLRHACFCLRAGDEGFTIRENPVKGTALSLLAPPPTERFVRWVHRLGEANRDSNRIEVPFSFIAPKEGERWSVDTSQELRVPIGRSGATKLQYLSLGKGTCQHALIAGKTGSGKSTLFHIIITNLALWCDPEEVEFYLIDFKKGVEFKCYADHHLPHARVIAIESDREFGLSVLQRLDEELKHRGELFRAAGVQDVAGYRARPGALAMPRTLLLIDEFQEFFTEDDQISQQAAVLLDRIVRQGRAFGIHAVLGSQTLGGAFTLARATLGQMTVRIALACNEADAYLIMDDSNPAPRLLTRPGEGIYNDRAGAAEANSPFQVVWMNEGERDDLLAGVASLAGKRTLTDRGRVVFEGNAPASVASDAFINRLVAGGAVSSRNESPRLFLGAPNAIKGPTEVSFSRQSGSNLLIVGQREDVVDAVVVIGLRLLRAQFGAGVRLVLLDSRYTEDESTTPYCRAVAAVGWVECPSVHEMGAVLNRLAIEMKAVADGEIPDPGQRTLLFIPNLHRYKKLRYEEDYSFSLDAATEAKPSDSLHELICEGPGWGYHVIVSLDSYNNVARNLGRKAAGEFEKKVLFQMSAGDSASLIDTGKASDLGLNRALYYDEPSGTLELFRPYAFPESDWFEAAKG